MLILLISACSSKTNQAKIQSEATQNKGIVGRLTKQLVETALQKNAAYFLGCHTDSILLRKICRGASGLLLPSQIPDAPL